MLAHTGAKLSKSLLCEQGKGVLPADVEPWMLDTAAWPGSVDDYVDSLVWLAGELLTDPKHFFRSFTVKELGRLMTARPTHLPTRAQEMGIYKRYFDLISSGRKTTEIRVNDSSRRKITEGLADSVPLPPGGSPHPRHPRRPVQQLRGDVRSRVGDQREPDRHPRGAVDQHPPNLPTRAGGSGRVGNRHRTGRPIPI
ncbi:MAG: ASCH domain-containing protein [Pseudonocardiaceae bacterium]